MKNDRFYVKIVGIIFDPKKRQILVGKNFGDKKYSFLEGNLDHDEEMDKTLKRITKEKTGFKIHNLGAVYAENMLLDKEKLKVHFLCEATEGKQKAGPNVEELVWVKPSQVEEKLGVKLPNRLREYIIGLE